MPSFDIVSEIKLEEVRNAVDNANRELSTRFDFRGVEASFELKESVVTMSSDSDFQLKQMLDILRGTCVKRGVDTAAFEEKDVQHIGKIYKQAIAFKEGIEQPVAKKLIKMIKDAKIKVQASIQGDQVRVTGKKRDDLQQVMALAKSGDLDQPLQFTNFRD
ncbi:MAG: YajQ family cyclic di-GMP-binding protein [Alteromonadaceae bacterium]|uniref:YajQ family cyclic di-GMP-binding protein n=1 Tax=Paraglaciecola chathamensis TaxID=368405 RepID=UPI000C390A70|nr:MULTISPECIES: YajQ family cyclic di-GMP-binding protein [Paraglaciecola]MBN27756.1 YajQ family cyclic di-GMP-binding protein [Alteromonadaceae bacterium]MDO6841164.1 YajQ family cyclic di-GMP-binding protein [Paraglaciecola chathamensis]|tara:strand:+ start:10133 stop:10615 length:483 start_codon:yes stop_codon:yes gene_type:complete